MNSKSSGRSERNVSPVLEESQGFRCICEHREGLMVKLFVQQLQHLQWIYHKSGFVSRRIKVIFSRWVSCVWPNLEVWHCRGSKTAGSFYTVHKEQEESSGGTRSCGFSPQAPLTNPLVLFCHYSRTAVSTSGHRLEGGEEQDMGI